MENLFKLMVVDKEYSTKVFNSWCDGSQDYDYISWLKIKVFHNTTGGGSKDHVIESQKLLCVLINELEN